MKETLSLLAVLALCVAPLTAGLATQPAPAEGGVKVGGNVHGKAASKTSVGGQKKLSNPGATGITSNPVHQPWRKNAAHIKEDATGPHLQSPELGTSGTKGGTSTTTATKLRKPSKGTGSSPLVGIGTGARISGTGMLPRGAVAAVIRPAPKNHGTISGTGIIRGN